jgi:hypothetical protein
MALSSAIIICLPQLIVVIIELSIGKTKLCNYVFVHNFHLIFSEHLKL